MYATLRGRHDHRFDDDAGIVAGSEGIADGAGEMHRAAPIWVLAAGWGSGSTLVQRLLMSSGEAFLWGEPLDQAAPIPHLAAPLATLRPGWPPPAHFRHEGDARSLAGEWVANLVPALAQLRRAQRRFVYEWLAQPARGRVHGANATFGMKEVRLSAWYGAYLKWLFPNSRLVFVVRHPYDCWRSCKGVDWYSVWPTHRVAHRLAFAHHWRYLAESFLLLAEELDALVIRYEALTGGGYDLDALARHAGVGALDGDVLARRIGSRRSERRRLGWWDRQVIGGVCGPAMARLGYST